MQRATAWIYTTRNVPGRNAQQAASLCRVSHQTNGPTQQTKPTGAAAQAVGSEEDSTPPSAARAIATMGAGGNTHCGQMLAWVTCCPCYLPQELESYLTCSPGSCSSCSCGGVGCLQNGHGSCRGHRTHTELKQRWRSNASCNIRCQHY